MTDFTIDDLDERVQRKDLGKARSKGTLPYLPDDDHHLQAWLTRATRPMAGVLEMFDRWGREGGDPCQLVFANGRDSRAFRVKRQNDLMRNPRMTLASVSDGWLRIPHLTPSEIEDVWAALCRYGRVLSEFDEAEQAREWVETYLPATLPLRGYSLLPDTRHDALMAMRKAGQFSRGDALALLRSSDDGRYAQRPCRFIDLKTAEQWVRSSELAAYLRHVIGVEPLPHSMLRARLREIGVVGRYFEDHRPPHPKLMLYQLTESLVETIEDEK